MAIEDAAEGFLGSDLLLGGMWDSVIKTSKEKAAEEARQKAIQQAQDQLGFAKGVYGENQNIWNDVEDQLFGRSEEELAQGFADDRQKLAEQGGFSGQTKSGRNAQFDFGTGAAPAGAQPDGAPAPAAPAQQEYTWDENGNRIPLPSGFKDTTSGVGVPQAAPAATPQEKLAAQVTASDRERAHRAAASQNTLPKQLQTARQRQMDAVDKLKADLDAIPGVTAGDYQDAWNVDANKQYISPEARAAQKAAMDKTWALTDTKETAEEKLMREVARRNMERDLRGQREAQADQLRTRGAYGSGAELAGFLGAQQELAQRRSLEEMGANANAQKRAMAALSAYGDQSFKLGSQDLQQGALQDVNERFNSTNKQYWQEFKTKTQQEEADRLARVASTKADADVGLSEREGNDVKFGANTKLAVAGGRTGTNISGAPIVGQARSNLAGNFRTKALELDAEDAGNKWGIF